MGTYEGSREQDGGNRDRRQTAMDISCYIVFTLEPHKLKNQSQSKWKNQCFKIENRLKEINLSKYLVVGITTYRKPLLQLTLKHYLKYTSQDIF